jgi:chitinase
MSTTHRMALTMRPSGADGWCGYGPTYCDEGCQSNCDAKAECGEFAAVPGAGCPLNVCCS